MQQADRDLMERAYLWIGKVLDGEPFNRHTQTEGDRIHFDLSERINKYDGKEEDSDDTD